MPFLQELAGINWVNTFEPLDRGHWLILLTAEAGIPEEEMALVLRPFYRGSQAECEPYRPGSGLGLAIA
ncbi:hypothetical protein DSM14862_03314 (plasmid) [Sulfitobacter indolifex]|nr:hypothetical protein DSM14862_03314 [Sulfitobacter indolifex]